MDVKKITVFCGAKTGKNENYEKAAFKLGRDAAKRNITIVYGGGATGLMGAVANGALSEQGHVTGVIPQFLVDREVAHPGVKICASSSLCTSANWSWKTKAMLLL